MAQMTTNDPLANISGLTPRYVRVRQAANEQASLAAAEAAAASAAAPAPDNSELFAALRPVDAATTELRRRVMQAASEPRRRRPSLMVTAPAVAGLGLVLWQLVSNIANGMPVVLHGTM